LEVSLPPSSSLELLFLLQKSSTLGCPISPKTLGQAAVENFLRFGSEEGE